MNDNATVAKYDSGGGYAGERKLSSALPITPESIGLTLMVAGKNIPGRIY